MRNNRLTRRALLKTASLAALATPYLIPASVLGQPGKPGANDRIRVGLIGTGGRPRDLLQESPLDLQLVAVADCDLQQIDTFLTWLRATRPEIAASKCAQYQDYRQMLEKEQLDGVFVATTTHARVLICLHAMQAGLDVYAEKPLTLTIEEGQYLIRAERKYQRGLSSRFAAAIDPHQQFWQRPGPRRRNRQGPHGAVPQLHRSRTAAPDTRAAHTPGHELGHVVQPDGPCSVLPRPASRIGKVGTLARLRRRGPGLGSNRLGDTCAGPGAARLGTDDTDPVEIWPEESGPNSALSLRYPSGTVLRLALPQGTGPGLGAIFVGDKGKIEINRNRLASNPPELIQGAPNPTTAPRWPASRSDTFRTGLTACGRDRSPPPMPRSGTGPR